MSRQNTDHETFEATITASRHPQNNKDQYAHGRLHFVDLQARTHFATGSPGRLSPPDKIFKSIARDGIG